MIGDKSLIFGNCMKLYFYKPILGGIDRFAKDLF